MFPEKHQGKLRERMGCGVQLSAQPSMYIYALRHPSASTHGASATFFLSAITVPFDKGIQSHTRIPNPG